jgi:hypothetical protein
LACSTAWVLSPGSGHSGRDIPPEAVKPRDGQDAADRQSVESLRQLRPLPDIRATGLFSEHRDAPRRA